MTFKKKTQEVAKGLRDNIKKADSETVRNVKARAEKAVKAGVERARQASVKASSDGEGAQLQKKKGNKEAVQIDGVYNIIFQRLRGWLARSALRYSIFLNITLGVVVAVLAIALATVANQPPPKPVYFATNPDGTVTKLVPLSRPNRTKSAVLNWAERVATECYTFSFVDVERKVSECERGYFTNKGAGAYRRSLIQAKLIQDIKDRELFYVTTLRGPAVILKTGKIKKKYLAYKIKVPVYVRITGPTTKETVIERTIYLMAVRVATVDKPSGLGVHQFIVE